jgi:hypothetical protein
MKVFVVIALNDIVGETEIVAIYTNKEMAKLHLKRIRQNHREWYMLIHVDNKKYQSPYMRRKWDYYQDDQDIHFKVMAMELHDHLDQFLGHYGDV